MSPFLGAAGIGVADMQKSIHFYTSILQLGLQPTQTFDVASFTETVLNFPRGSKPTGSPIILMQYKNASIPKNQQGKLVFYVEDVDAVMQRCKAYGSEVFLEPGQSGVEWAKSIGMVRDPDGFLVEFIPMTALSKSGNSGKEMDSKIWRLFEALAAVYALC